MINHIDVSTVLRRTVCDLYSNLVTRPTGAAVRTEIELQLAAAGRRTLTVIDFSNVNLLDFSCADEIVAKLLLRYGATSASHAGPDASRDADRAPALPHEGYFLFRGLHEAHLDAVEAVLERHGLALVADGDAGPRLVGMVDDGERRAWETVSRLGAAAAEDLARATGQPVADAEARLDALCRRRLLMRLDESYVAVAAVAGGRRPAAGSDLGGAPGGERDGAAGGEEAR